MIGQACHPTPPIDIFVVSAALARTNSGGLLHA